MQSLADLSFATLFEYLANKPLDKNTKELFVSYLEENKSIINKYLSRESVYGVYFRGQYNCKNKKHIELTKLFGTFDAAYKWVISYGAEIVSEQENIEKTPIVLLIIELFPDNIQDQVAITTPIIANKCPTFAFSKRGYDMLLDEHKKWFLGSWSEEIFCDWIYLVEDNSLVMQGCSWEHVLKLSSYVSGDEKNKMLNDALEKFKKIDYSLQNHSKW